MGGLGKGTMKRSIFQSDYKDFLVLTARIGILVDHYIPVKDNFPDLSPVPNEAEYAVELLGGTVVFFDKEDHCMGCLDESPNPKRGWHRAKPSKSADKLRHARNCR